LRPGAVAEIFDEFGGERDLFALRDDDASAAFERDVHLLLNRVLDGDLDKSEIADEPCLVGMVCSHPAIVLEVPPSAKIAWGAVFQVLTIFQMWLNNFATGGVEACVTRNYKSYEKTNYRNCCQRFRFHWNRC